MRREIPFWVTAIVIVFVVLVIGFMGWRLITPQRSPVTTTELQNLQQQMQKALQQQPVGPTQRPLPPHEMMQRALQQQPTR